MIYKCGYCGIEGRSRIFEDKEIYIKHMEYMHGVVIELKRHLKHKGEVNKLYVKYYLINDYK